MERLTLREQLADAVVDPELTLDRGVNLLLRVALERAAEGHGRMDELALVIGAAAKYKNVRSSDSGPMVDADLQAFLLKQDP